jgi:transposase
MDVVNDDAKDGFRRVEVLTGPGRRRRWSAVEKGRIVAESLEAGGTVTEVARRWQVWPQQVWGWRREARAGALVLPSGASIAAEPDFVPIVAESSAPVAMSSAEPAPKHAKASAAMIEIRLAGAVVRVATDTDAALLSDLLRAMRASAT